MLEALDIEKFARDAADKQFNPGQLERVLTEATTDSEGKEAVRIIFVLSKIGVRDITGDQALDLLTDIQSRFERQGDGRFPIIEYATEEDLAADEKDVESDEDDI